MKAKFSGQWYNEYKNDVRIHDYFSIMVHQFPILVIRKFDFGLHSGNHITVYSIGVIGFTFIPD